MISSLRKGIVAFAMFALLSTIPAAAWADGTINAEPAANMAPQASQVATWDCSDGGIVPESVYGRVDKPTVTFFTEGTFYQDTARNMLDYINEARSAVGAAPLTWSYELEVCAMQRAAEISIGDVFFSHTRPSGDTCFTVVDDVMLSNSYYALGENILGTTYDVATANSWWTNSPGHYANMINENFNMVGVACFNGYWVEFFGYQPFETTEQDAVNGTYNVNLEMGQCNLGLFFPDFEAGEWYADTMVYMLNNGLITGYNDGTHRLGVYDSIKRGDVAMILWRMAGKPDVSVEQFYDVPSDSYYSAAINWARAAGIIGGYTDPVYGTPLNLFGPEDYVTREQFAVMIAKYANILWGVDVSSDGTKLASMPDASTVSPWARASLAWALDAGVMDGREIDGTRYLDPQGSAWRSAVGKMTATLERDVLQ